MADLLAEQERGERTRGARTGERRRARRERRHARSTALSDRIDATPHDDGIAIVVHSTSPADWFRLERRAWLALACLTLIWPMLAALGVDAWLLATAATVPMLVGALMIVLTAHDRGCHVTLDNAGLFRIQRGRWSVAGRRNELELAIYRGTHDFLDVDNVELRCLRNHAVLRLDCLKRADAARLRRLIGAWGGRVV